MLLRSQHKDLAQRVLLKCFPSISSFSALPYNESNILSKKHKRLLSQKADTHSKLPLPSSHSPKKKRAQDLTQSFSDIDINEPIITNDCGETALTNEQILETIKLESLRRTKLRQHYPAQEWTNRFANKERDFLVRQYIKNGRVTIPLLQKAITVGDLVLILERSLKVHIVVGLPQNIKSNTYTFLNEDGDIIYGPKSCISLRVPAVIPKSLIKSLSLIKLEKKYPGVAPSGMPDSMFSRNGSNGTSEAIKQTEAGHDKPESTSSGAIPTEVSLHNVGDALLVAQAASQFLADTDVNTFIVPVSARKVYANSLRDLSLSVLKLIPKYTERLNLLYDTLEKNKHDSLVFFRKSYSIFELFGVVHKDRKLPNILNVCLPPTNILILDYIAFLCSLKLSSRTWNTHVQKSTMTTIRVSFRSKLDYLQSESTKLYLRNKGMRDFESFYINFLRDGGVSSIPISILQVTKMLKSFVADGCSHDQMMASLISTLIKRLDIRSKNEGLLPDSISHAVDDPRSRAHEILTILSGNYIQSPVTWLETSKIPHTETSLEADYFADYHEYMNDSNREIPKSDEYAKDPLARVRENFGNVPVYCIDSANAHEIDDGISISNGESQFIITVHVANPTSYIRPESQLFKISNMMGSTNYSPEGPIMMLPESISRKSGLGQLGSKFVKMRRTLAIEFKLNKTEVLKYINDIRSGNKNLPSDDIAKIIRGNIISTARIKAYHASCFPKNLTYQKVNEILNDENNIKQFNAKKLSSNSHELNLFYLYHISSILRHIRMGLGSGLETYAPQSTVTVDFTEQEQPCQLFDVKGGWSLPLERGASGITPIISITKDTDQCYNSKSQQLVSNFMIAANFAGATFAENNKIPFIYKRQSLELSENVKNTVENLNKRIYETESSPTVELQLDMMSMLTSAHLSTDPGKHDSLGLERYLNLTSPLRRYVDLVNHYNLQLFLKGKKCETKKNLELIAGHLQACEYSSRVSQRFANKFWTCKFLERYFNLLSLGKIDKPIPFSFVLMSDAKYGDVKASIIEFPGINATISQNVYIEEKFAKNEFQVGHVAETKNFRVQSLDFINGELVVEFLDNCI